MIFVQLDWHLVQQITRTGKSTTGALLFSHMGADSLNMCSRPESEDTIQTLYSLQSVSDALVTNSL